MANRYHYAHVYYLNKMRRYFIGQLPLPCWRCGKLIYDADAMDVGHRIDLALGGDVRNAWPEHRYAIPGVCEGNRGHGSQVRARHIGASRQW